MWRAIKNFSYLLLCILATTGYADVQQNGSIWYIEENSFSVQVNETNFSVDISKSNSSIWQMNRSITGEEIEVSGSWRSLSDAQSKNFSEYNNGDDVGVKAQLTGFPGASNVELNVYVYIDKNRNECVIDVEPEHDPNRVLGECKYPRGFELENSWSNSFVNPSGNGGYGSLENMNSGINMREVRTYAHGELYMAWWGYLKDYDLYGHNGEGFIAMVSTPYDFSLSAYSENNRTTVFGKWRLSLGGLRYKRSMRYDVFESDCDYVVLAKRYRRFLIEEGRYKTFDEKAQINPNIHKMKGMAQFTRYITQCHSATERSYYQTFYQAKEHCDQFYNRFNTKPTFFVMLREWHEGELSEGGTPYDLSVNGPLEKAGGWDGLKAVADWCDQTDNFLYLYDTYHDIAKTSELSLYNTNLVIRNRNGGIPSHSWWCGDYQFATICPVKRLELFRHNLDQLKQRGINIKANYMDITVIREPEECYSDEHSHGEYGDPETGHLSKEGYCRAVEDFYNWCAQQGVIVLSEHPVEWAWPFVMGSFFVVPKGGKLYSRTYVPLLHLVAHDAITGGEYVDTYHTGSDPQLFMQHLSHAIFPIPRENLASDAVWTERICNLHRKVAFKQMTDHKFVDGNYYIHKTTFEDGTEVQVNYQTGEYSINTLSLPQPDLTPPEIPTNVGVQKLP